MSKKYVDYKATIWGRIHFEDEADMQKVIAELEKGKLPDELCDDPELKFKIFEFQHDTEEFITPIENDGQSTIEVYEGDDSFQELVWDNSFESELKRKQKFKVIICPHTNKEVVAMYNPGDDSGYPDYLCLHNEENPEQDAEDVEYFKKTGKLKERK